MMSKDKKPLSIEVKLTNRCNQECLHCANRDGFGSEGRLDDGLFVRRLDEWARQRDRSSALLQEVRMTGGEPLLNFEAALVIAACCRRLGLRSGINTNGLLLDPERLRALKDAGVEVLKIAFDAVDTAVYNRLRGSLTSFSTFREMIMMSVRLGFKVILRFTLSRMNREQLPLCRRAALDLGVHKFQVKPLIQAGRALDLDGSLSREEVEDALRSLSQMNAGTRLPVEILCWPPSPDSGFAYKICGNSDKIYVSTSMVVSICNYIEGARCRPLGDLSRTPLETLLRRRQEDHWSERVNGYKLVKDCPNAVVFKSAPVR